LPAASWRRFRAVSSGGVFAYPIRRAARVNEPFGGGERPPYAAQTL